MLGRRGDASTPVPDAAWSPDAGTPALRQPEQISLPGYHDFALIARGGSSVVYRARQVTPDRLVAVKVLTIATEPGEGQVSAAHFQRELEITVRLGQAHPHIVTVLNTLLTAEGQPCLVMEYYELGSLHDRLRVSGPLTVKAVIAVGTVIADALDFAHGQGVLHRDVKPQNILVLPTSYVLADFGLARPIDSERSASLERFSYRHAAPQVLDGEMPDITDDIYSFGSTLFTLLDGRPPFAGDIAESDAALSYIRRVRTSPPRDLRGTAPAELAAVIGRCLSKRREDRFPDAASLRQALVAVQIEERAWAPRPATSAHAPSPPAPPTTTPTATVPTATAPTATAPTATAPTATTPTATTPSGAISSVAGDAAWAPAPSEVIARTTATDLAATQWAAANTSTAIAASALEHLGAPPPPLPAAKGDDDDEQTAGREQEQQPQTVADVRARRGPRLAVLVGIALVIGGLIGLGGTWIWGAGKPAGQTTPPTGAPVPAFSGTIPTPAGSPRVSDPTLAPTITALVDKGTSFELTWTDNSSGKAIFVVIEVVGASGVPLTQTATGQTTVVVGGIDATRPYCLAVIAVTDTAQAISPLRCTGTRSAT